MQLSSKTLCKGIHLLIVVSMFILARSSLQTALHESALEYYGNHSKRVRRKRNRQAGSTGTAQAYGVLATPLASSAFCFELLPIYENVGGTFQIDQLNPSAPKDGLLVMNIKWVVLLNFVGKRKSPESTFPCLLLLIMAPVNLFV